MKVQKLISRQLLTGCAVAVLATAIQPAMVVAQCACGDQMTGYSMNAHFSIGAIVTSPPPVHSQCEAAQHHGVIRFTVILPEEAKLTVNGDPTASEGKIRYFIVRHLDLDKEYKFEFAAEKENAAQVVLEEKKTLTLKAGASQIVYLCPYKKKPEEAAPESDDDESSKVLPESLPPKSVSKITDNASGKVKSADPLRGLSL